MHGDTVYIKVPHLIELCVFDLLHVLLPDVSPQVVAGDDWALRW